ncbi:dual specificity protein phosphatase 1-A-like [Centruroides vittatus]|uniref:dual specificity protein phosphatase 1-A-like n=1 Tax=Centruroides vittatus TaxID=120091 RepID=UPI00350F2B72
MPRIKNYKLVNCDKLCSYLETLNVNEDVENDFLLIFDCRPLFAFSECHIIGSINVHCPNILRRRYGSRLPLRAVVSKDSVREKLISGIRVILYEEENVEEEEESMAVIVAKCLQLEASLSSIYLLSGGFSQFKAKYPHLCADSGSPFNGILLSLTGSPLCRTPPIRGRLAMEEEPVELLPYLYLGSAHHASSKSILLHLGITGLVNVSQNCPNYFEDTFTYLSIPIEDSNNEDIAIWFNQAIGFIERFRSENGKVLVHCHAGVSRSATICMAYLMATRKLRMEEAYEYVKKKRRIVSPNFNFMGQLLSFEAQVTTVKTYSPKSLVKPQIEKSFSFSIVSNCSPVSSPCPFVRESFTSCIC